LEYYVACRQGRDRAILDIFADHAGAFFFSAAKQVAAVVMNMVGGVLFLLVL
jgi:hypothetical protein